MGSWCEAGPPCQFGGPSVCECGCEHDFFQRPGSRLRRPDSPSRASVAARKPQATGTLALRCPRPGVMALGGGGIHCERAGSVTVHHPDTKDAGRDGIFGRRRMCEGTSGEARRLSVLEVWCYASVHTRAGVWLGRRAHTGQDRTGTASLHLGDDMRTMPRQKREAGGRALPCHRPWPKTPAGSNRSGRGHGARGGRELLFTVRGMGVLRAWGRTTARWWASGWVGGTYLTAAAGSARHSTAQHSTAQHNTT